MKNRESALKHPIPVTLLQTFICTGKASVRHLYPITKSNLD